MRKMISFISDQIEVRKTVLVLNAPGLHPSQ